LLVETRILSLETSSRGRRPCPASRDATGDRRAHRRRCECVTWGLSLLGLGLQALRRALGVRNLLHLVHRFDGTSRAADSA